MLHFVLNSTVLCISIIGQSIERPYLMTGLNLIYFYLMKSVESTDLREIGGFTVDSVDL